MLKNLSVNQTTRVYGEIWFSGYTSLQKFSYYVKNISYFWINADGYLFTGNFEECKN